MPKKEGHEAKYEQALQLLNSCQSVRHACRIVEVDATNFLNWVEKDQERKLQYARAKPVMADNYAHATIDLYDQTPERIGVDQRIDPAWVSLLDKKAQSRFWLLQRLDPRYANATKHIGDADNPVAINVIERRIVDTKS